MDTKKIGSYVKVFELDSNTLSIQKSQAKNKGLFDFLASILYNQGDKQ